MASEDEPEEDVAEDEGKKGLETVSGTSALEEVPPDHYHDI